jgi:protein-histidine pros-kinase
MGNSSNVRYRVLFESTPDSVIMVNATGTIVLANLQAQRLFGYAEGELSGRQIDTLLPQRLRHAHVGHRARYFDQPRTRTMGADLELLGLRKGNVEFPVEISLSPLETDEGMLVSSAIRDITERKRIEHTLYEQKIELERASQAKDRFLTSMSHELRTPLNAILGFAQLLANEALPATALQKRAFVQNIVTSGRHLLTLINEILDLAKIESGSLSLSIEPVRLPALLEEVRVMVEEQAQQRQIEMVFSACEPLTVRADHTRLKQVLLNLLSNAIKYNHAAGKVALDISQPDAQRVRIAIRDTGKGLDEAQLAELFQPFNRLGQEAGSKEGTGIGLVVTRRLVELMGGDMGVHSCVGVGSVFWIELDTMAAPSGRMPPGVEELPDSAGETQDDAAIDEALQLARVIVPLKPAQ